jgi:hypothetical protein
MYLTLLQIKRRCKPFQIPVIIIQVPSDGINQGGISARGDGEHPISWYAVKADKGTRLLIPQLDADLKKIPFWQANPCHVLSFGQQEEILRPFSHRAVLPQEVSILRTDTLKLIISRGQPDLPGPAGRKLGNEYFTNDTTGFQIRIFRQFHVY